jgi:Uma2 family endonuclease
MHTLVLDPAPVEFTALLAQRRRLGLDRRDEVWRGVLHVNPGPHGRHHRVQQQLAELLGPAASASGLVAAIGDFNLGAEDDYRVPDGGLHRPGSDEMYYATAALVVEIVSPDDETWQKLPFYAAHGVEELLIVDPLERAVHWLGLRGEGDRPIGYEPIERSGLIELGVGDLAERIEWP